MKLTELFCLEGIDLNANITNRNEAIDYLIELMMTNHNIIDKNSYKQEILKCENQSTVKTELLYAKTESVIKPGIAAIVVKNENIYDSLDEFSTQLFLMIAMPEENKNDYLKIVARLSQLLTDQSFNEQLINADSPTEFMALINAKEIETEKIISESENSYDVLTLIACSSESMQALTAAECLQKKAKEMNISLKVEINRDDVIRNVFTNSEIEKARGIIIVTDKQIDMSRFDDKPVIITRVENIINDPEMLLKKAVSKQAEIYHSQDKIETIKNNDILKILFTQLNEGINKILPILIGAGALISIATLAVSYNLFNINSLTDNVWIANSYVFGNAIQGMIVALLAGFIGQRIALQVGFASGFSCGVATQLNTIYLNDVNNPGILGGIIAGFIGGYMVIVLQKLCKDMPKQFDEVKLMIIYPVFSIIIAGIITYLISPYIGSFNHMIAVLISEMNLLFKLMLGIIIGTMMAIDMGGPINKIAYIFGISQILEGNFDVMASIMAGGMVPPLAIAFATSFFEDKFTNQEIKMGQDNFLKGLLFISDGTIPFVHKNPQLVTVICIVASSIASALAMIYNCEIRIPHGGIFVLPFMVHPLRFLVSLLAGSICGGAIYGLWKESSK